MILGAARVGYASAKARVDLSRPVVMLTPITDEAVPVAWDRGRTVDLLVFMYKIGEFQLRVARDQRLTLGYFNQEMFERTQVIVSRKLGMG